MENNNPAAKSNNRSLDKNKPIIRHKKRNNPLTKKQVLQQTISNP